jgi:hypothetical protein
MQNRTTFAVWTGLYAGGAAATLGSLAGASVAGLPPVVVTAVVGAVVGALGLAVTRRYATVTQIEALQGRDWTVAGILSTPLTLLVLVVAVTAQPLLAGGFNVFSPSLGGAILSLVGAFGVVHTAQRAHVARLVRESDTRLELPGPYATLRSYHGRWLAIGGVAVAGLALATLALTDGGLGGIWLVSVLGGAGLIAVRLTDSNVVVLEEGLQRGVSVRPWTEFESFAVTDDALVIREAGRFRGTYELPRSRVENEREAISALSQYLPERPQ